jgi:hypothetical protein
VNQAGKPENRRRGYVIAKEEVSGSGKAFRCEGGGPNVGVHSAPGWSGNAICSVVRVREGLNFVQFIVLMEWIRFRGVHDELHKRRRQKLKIQRISLAERVKIEESNLASAE